VGGSGVRGSLIGRICGHGENVLLRQSEGRAVNPPTLPRFTGRARENRGSTRERERERDASLLDRPASFLRFLLLSLCLSPVAHRLAREQDATRLEVDEALSRVSRSFFRKNKAARGHSRRYSREISPPIAAMINGQAARRGNELMSVTLN